MTTQEKKTPEKEPVKVTSGKDFVAAKPVEQKEPEKANPKDLGPSDDEVAAHEAKMKKLNDDFERRKAEIAAEEQELRRQQQERAEKERAYNEEQAAIAAAKASRDNELGKAHFGGDNVQRQGVDPERVPGRRVENERGEPIPVTEQNQRVRHISEIGDSYNGKDDTITDR